MGKQPQRHDDREEPPRSGRRPSGNIAKRGVEAMAEDLVKFHALFEDLFVRRAQREWSEFYLRGQLSDLERKTAEPMVLQLKAPIRRPFAPGSSSSVWGRGRTIRSSGALRS